MEAYSTLPGFWEACFGVDKSVLPPVWWGFGGERFFWIGLVTFLGLGASLGERMGDDVNREAFDDAARVRVQGLFVRHQGVVKAFILSLQPGFADAEDVLQETFLVVTRKAGEFVPGTNFVAWACAIARLKLLEARRKASRPVLSEAAMVALCEDAPEEAFFDERLGALRSCVEKLAPKARELVWLRYHSELGSAEIAEKTGWKDGAVRVALTKARGFLRKCVQRQVAAGGGAA